MYTSLTMTRACGRFEKPLNSIGMKVEAFSTTADFLGSKIADEVSCLILDVRLRGQNGLDFQDELTKANLKIPIIFITGHGERLGITQQK